MKKSEPLWGLGLCAADPKTMPAVSPTEAKNVNVSVLIFWHAL